MTTTTTGTYTPKPGAAPLGRMIATQAVLETKMLLRNGEQLLLTVIIPTLLLLLFSSWTSSTPAPARPSTSSRPASWRSP